MQLAASAASPAGGCARSRLDHGLKFSVIWGGCASSRRIHGSPNTKKLKNAKKKIVKISDNSLKTRPKKTEIILPCRPRGLARAWSPRAQARAPAKKDGKFKETAKSIDTIIKNI